MTRTARRSSVPAALCLFAAVPFACGPASPASAKAAKPSWTFGAELRYVLRLDRFPPGERPPAAGAAERAREVIRRRFDPKGTGEVDVRSVEKPNPEILVWIPHTKIARLAEIKESLRNTGRLELRIALPEDHPFYHVIKEKGTKAGEAVPGHPEYRVLESVPTSDDPRGGSGRIIVDFGGEKGVDWMSGTTIVSASAEFRAGLARSSRPWIVWIHLDQEGKDQMSALSKRHRKKPLAILLDGKCYSAPIIQEVLDDGQFYVENLSGGKEEAGRIANILNAGALPAVMELQEETVVLPEGNGVSPAPGAGRGKPADGP